MFLSATAVFALLSIAVTSVTAEKHIVTFSNNCGHGTVSFSIRANVLSTGAAYTINGPLISAIAYLQTGPCGFNGEGCTMLETTLRNPTSPDSGTSTDLTLITPHAFSVTTGFGYYNGCDGAGADCTSGSCSTAFHVSTDKTVQVQCQANDVNLVVCPITCYVFHTLTCGQDHLLLVIMRAVIVLT
ncbi:glycopeptide [Mycena capillaripes]|nr:glycopeptide [Mycena capillaripes]